MIAENMLNQVDRFSYNSADMELNRGLKRDEISVEPWFRSRDFDG